MLISNRAIFSTICGVSPDEEFNSSVFGGSGQRFRGKVRSGTHNELRTVTARAASQQRTRDVKSTYPSRCPAASGVIISEVVLWWDKKQPRLCVVPVI